MRSIPVRVYVVALMLLVMACSDDPEPTGKRNIFPFLPGNYWIYKTTAIYPDESFQVFDHLDSVWIVKDTLIDGKNYWLQRGTLSGDFYFRDSADCVLMRQLTYEQIVYSRNRSDTLYSSPLYVKIITDVNESVSTQAGQFKTSDCRTLLRKKAGDDDHGAHFPLYGKNFYTAEQFICSEKSGLVKRVNYYIGNRIEYELVRYSLN